MVRIAGVQRTNADAFDTVRTCRRCRALKPREDFVPDSRRTGGLGSYCRECQRLFASEWSRNQRLRILDHYRTGPVPSCWCCDETEIQFLAIDHIDGGGRQSIDDCSERGETFYRWIVKNGFPSNLRILCHNCNQARGLYGTCPHENDGAREAAG